MNTVMDGVIIGGAGGAIAGITVYLVQYLHTKAKDWLEARSVYTWLKMNTVDERGRRYRSTRAIASWCNLTEDRVRQLCSHHKGIYLSTGKAEDMWSIYIRSSEERDDEGPRITAI
jgi:hypothetical protein